MSTVFPPPLLERRARFVYEGARQAAVAALAGTCVSGGSGRSSST
jgi:hypothetical protein